MILFTEASILRLLIAKGSGMDQGYMTKLKVVKSYRIYGCVLRETQWYKPKMPRSQPLLANTQKISFDP